MVAEWVTNPISKFLGLKALVSQRLDIQMTEISELLGKGKNQITMDLVDIETAAPYAAADATMTWRLIEPLQQELQTAGLENLYGDLELPLAPIISDMQFHGVALDVDYLRDMSGRLHQSINELQDQIYEMGGIGKFNISSPKQLNTVLFETLRAAGRWSEEN